MVATVCQWQLSADDLSIPFVSFTPDSESHIQVQSFLGLSLQEHHQGDGRAGWTPATKQAIGAIVLPHYGCFENVIFGPALAATSLRTHFQTGGVKSLSISFWNMRFAKRTPIELDWYALLCANAAEE